MPKDNVSVLFFSTMQFVYTVCYYYIDKSKYYDTVCVRY